MNRTIPFSAVLLLLPNPQGRSEMVRITVIAADPAGKWVGATTVSKLVPGAQRKQKGATQETVERLARKKDILWPQITK